MEVTLLAESFGRVGMRHTGATEGHYKLCPYLGWGKTS